jgi:Flp pilus assembly protein protease CpaA
MNPDYFLFAVGLVWAAFASVQDIKTKEVANWLNFSLVFIGLFFRLAVWMSGGDAGYFVNGLASFAMFFCLSYAFYYGSIFAGGDAKLLIGLGTIIPGASLPETLFNGIFFIFALLLIGAAWSIIALFTPLVPLTWNRFYAALRKRRKWYYWLLPLFVVLCVIIFSFISAGIATVSSFLVALAILGYPCLKAVEECMIIQVGPSKLTEGDWIISDIKVGRNTVAKTIHGLNKKDIVLLRKAGRKVTIKTGVPFSPAFFFTLLIMVFFWVWSSHFVEQVFQFLLP